MCLWMVDIGLFSPHSEFWSSPHPEWGIFQALFSLSSLIGRQWWKQKPRLALSCLPPSSQVNLSHRFWGPQIWKQCLKGVGCFWASPHKLASAAPLGFCRSPNPSPPPLPCTPPCTHSAAPGSWLCPWAQVFLSSPPVVRDRGKRTALQFPFGWFPRTGNISVQLVCVKKPQSSTSEITLLFVKPLSQTHSLHTRPPPWSPTHICPARNPWTHFPEMGHSKAWV